MNSVKKNIICLLFFVLSVSNLHSQGKEFKLRNGSILTMVPSENKEFVEIMFFREYNSDYPGVNQNLQSELYFQELIKALNQIGINAYASPKRMLPENRYNWFQHQYIAVSMTKSQFSINADQIVSIFETIPELKKPRLDRLLLSYSEVFDNSVLYTREQLRQIENIITELDQYSESRAGITLNSDSIANSLRIYIYGGFNPLEVSKLLINPEEVPDQNTQSLSTPNAETGVTVKMLQDNQQTIIRMIFAGSACELQPVLLFITDFLKQKIHRISGVKEVRAYYPWKASDPEIIIFMNRLQARPDSGMAESLLSQILNVTKDEFTDWYYSEYVKYLENIKSDPEKYILAWFLYKSAGWEPEKFEAINLNPDEIFNRFRVVVSGLKNHKSK